MNSPSNKKVSALRNAAQNKRATTLERVLVALELMEEKDFIINFESVSNFAKVSKTWLYANKQIKSRIVKLKSTSHKNVYLKNQAEKLKNKDDEIASLKYKNKMLKREINELKSQLETAYISFYSDEI